MPQTKASRANVASCSHMSCTYAELPQASNPIEMVSIPGSSMPNCGATVAGEFMVLCLVALLIK